MEMIVDFFIICASLRFYIFFFLNSASCFKSLQNSHSLAMVYAQHFDFWPRVFVYGSSGALWDCRGHEIRKQENGDA